MKKEKRKGSRRRRIIWVLFSVAFLITAVSIIVLTASVKKMEEEFAGLREEMISTYGENRVISRNSFDRTLAVTCENGTFVGKKQDRVRAYKGIPYAKPPVGDLRWKRPVPAPADDKVYEAFWFGKSGIQTEAETERASFYPQGEDCLTLNIWTSDSTAGSGKPVMVFFPGGGYGWGGTADPIYDGHNFVSNHDDVVLVTVNYRIGIMGFIDFSEVDGGEEFRESGNLGLLDQICALKWIRKNIKGFGGDPDQVTIFGESAGGSSVSLLPLISEAKGLFRRVIAQSGSVAFTFSRDECRDFTKKLLKKTGARSMKDLMALSEEALMKVNKSLNDYNNFPERDGVILPEDPYEAYLSGAASGVDMMIGSNADETRYWIGEVGGYWIYTLAGSLLYKSTVARFAPEDRHYADDFIRLQSGKKIWKRTQFMNELLFRIPAVVQAAAHAETGGNTYMYYWTKASAIPHYGACHAVELSYVFGNLDDTIFTGERADPILAQTVQDMWVAFAKTGNPSVTGHTWKPYEMTERNTMFLGDEIREVSDPMPEERKLIEPLLSYRINGYAGLYDDAVKYMKREILYGLRIFLILQAVIFAVYLIIRHLKKGKITGVYDP